MGPTLLPEEVGSLGHPDHQADGGEDCVQPAHLPLHVLPPLATAPLLLLHLQVGPPVVLAATEVVLLSHLVVVVVVEVVEVVVVVVEVEVVVVMEVQGGP